jgi:hypothetical protein
MKNEPLPAEADADTILGTIIIDLRVLDAK